jgi:predicted TPR repeat methyltransferase
VAAAAAGALRPGGVLVFTVEELADGAGWSIGPSGRYRHARGYVERVLADAGLEPEIDPAELRLESGERVAGLVVRGRRRR